MKFLYPYGIRLVSARGVVAGQWLSSALIVVGAGYAVTSGITNLAHGALTASHETLHHRDLDIAAALSSGSHELLTPAALTPEEQAPPPAQPDRNLELPEDVVERIGERFRSNLRRDAQGRIDIEATGEAMLNSEKTPMDTLNEGIVNRAREHLVTDEHGAIDMVATAQALHQDDGGFLTIVEFGAAKQDVWNFYDIPNPEDERRKEVESTLEFQNLAAAYREQRRGDAHESEGTKYVRKPVNPLVLHTLYAKPAAPRLRLIR